MKLKLLLEKIDILNHQLQQKRILDNFSILEALKIQYTYDSNRIEGNTLTLRETDLVIHKGITISGKALVEHLEAINHYEAIEYIIDIVKQKIDINETIIKNIHAIILKSINQKQAGIYRNEAVLISGSKHIPTNYLKIYDEMQNMLIWYANNKAILHPVILAAQMHEKIATIHPFIDGNGRTSRLVMNLILLQNNYPIANISSDNNVRLEYYNALEKCNIDNDTSDFILLIANNIYIGLQRLLSI